MSSESGPVAKKLRRLELQVRRNRPEMKSITSTASAAVASGNISVFTLNQIGQGDTVSTRDGDKIRVYRHDIRCYAPPGIDVFVISSSIPTAPTAAVFTNTVNCHIIPASTSSYFEHVHFGASTTNNYAYNGSTAVSFPVDQRLTRVVRFPSGKIVRYTGSGASAIVDGYQFIVFVNNTAAQLTYECSVKTWFTDV